MKYASVCSGLEAASVAWERLGWKPALLSEIEDFPRAVLAHRQNAIDAAQTDAAKRGIPLWGDFTAIRPRFLRRLGIDGTIDLVVGGTPCQDFSVAGKRAGLDGARGNLTFEFAHLLRRTGPRWFIWENVPGCFTSNKGKDFGAVLARFAGHAPGSSFDVPPTGWGNSGMVEPAGPGSYGLAWRVLDAQYVRVDSAPRAVPQRRNRVFVIGYLGDWRPAAAVLLERESLSWDSPPRRQPGQIPAPTLSARTKAGGGLGTDFDLDGGLVANTLLGKPNDSFAADLDNYVAHTLKGEGFDASEDGTGPGTPIIATAYGGGNTGGPISTAACLTAKGQRIDFEIETFIVSPRGENDNTPIAFDCKASGRNGFGIGRVAPTLRAMGHTSSHQNAGGHLAVAYSVMPMNSGTDYKARETDIAQPLLAAAPANGIQGGDFIAQNMAVRRLTPKECERLQNFPDNYTLIPMKRRRAIPYDEARYIWAQAEPGIKCWCDNGKWYTNAAPDGPRYKALGNSMATNVMEWIGNRVDQVDRLLKQMNLTGAA